nr:MAG TPA: protein of unknown function (DUF4145) [Caudoviricetes sp.]
MSGFKCPFCSMIIPLTPDTQSVRHPSFVSSDDVHHYGGESKSHLELSFIHCPNCGEYTISAKGKGSAVDDVDITIRPQSMAYKFPDYIPQAIRSDYEEACSIVNLSPKASATLSRRCLQGMIRDFFQISKGSLFEEINAIKDKIPTEQWAVLDGLRRIGNIGAHMEKDINLIVDIEPDEAQKLIKLIELLLRQWYIERHNQQELFADIIGIDQAKQQERKKTE